MVSVAKGMGRMRHQEAFTLVELLVVIGVIAVLIAMLLPALNKTRAAANAVACASNMRQIGAMFHTYATQYRAYPLSLDNTKAPKAANWVNHGDKWMFALEHARLIANASNVSRTPQPNISNPGDRKHEHARIYCPSHETDAYFSYAVIWGEGNNAKSIAGNARPNGDDNRLPEWCRPGQVRRMSEKIMLLEMRDFGFTTGGRWQGAMKGNEPNAPISYRHNKATNVLFGDGHVERVPDGTYTFTGPSANFWRHAFVDRY
jgi:prepilin-type processing-associated H-X9-DG protein/prepilin-type N-terminal cleavage/methylation domain-containing protein